MIIITIIIVALAASKFLASSLSLGGEIIESERKEFGIIIAFQGKVSIYLIMLPLHCTLHSEH